MTKPKIVAVAGPTASGKSDLALALARRFGGEIVCCDSMQIYRDMDVGTAKPTRAERALVPHHMTDFLDPSEKYSCAEYADAAQTAVRDIASRGRLPVICGGTGLYLDSLLYARPYGESAGESEVRKALCAEAERVGPHAMWERLNAVDPESAARIHENNGRRVIRALEIYRLTGRKKSELDRIPAESRYDACVLILHTADRTLQNRRIEARADRMIAAGLAEETRRLLEAGVLAPGTTASQAIGYKEMLGFVRGETSLAEAREKLIVATRQYAKRQDTWFARTPCTARLELSEAEPDPYPRAERVVAEFLNHET